MKSNRILIILSLIISTVALFLTLNNNKMKDVYYVNNGKLYEGFKLKQEYENQIQTIRNNRKNNLDSIELSLKQYQAKKMNDEFEYTKNYYLEKAKEYEEEEDRLLTEYNQQIWSKLNQYAIDYSKENNIDILFGATGNGTILHAKEEIDITNKLIEYSNSRYNGK